MAKVIFHPGRAVSTAWLNSSQYLGPSNPGVVFVANPINDWEYPLLKGASLDIPDLQGYFVTRTANQSIDGVKTFTSIPQFPAATQISGPQAVNIDRLNLDINTLNTTISDQISTINSQTIASINSTNTNLNTNFVTLSTNQAITGIKTFSNITVPITPLSAASPVALQYFNDNAVRLGGNQSIAGIKDFQQILVPVLPTLAQSPISRDYYLDNTARLNADQVIAGVKVFTQPISVPTAVSNSQAINLAQLTSALMLRPLLTENCLKIDNTQIVWGYLSISGDLNNTGILNESVALTTASPAMAPFLSIKTCAVSCDRFVALQTSAGLNSFTAIMDTTGIFQPGGGRVYYLIIGLV